MKTLEGREENQASQASRRQEMTKPYICSASTDPFEEKYFLSLLRFGRLFQPLRISLIYWWAIPLTLKQKHISKIVWMKQPIREPDHWLGTRCFFLKTQFSFSTVSNTDHRVNGPAWITGMTVIQRKRLQEVVGNANCCISALDQHSISRK